MSTDKPETEPKRQLITQKLDASQFSPELRAKLAAFGEVNKVSPRELVLYFPPCNDPFQIEVNSTLSIGRADASNNINPTIDLTAHFAAQLGVSRFHAEIIFNNNNFYIKDMGSTNGTQINGKRLPPYRQVAFYVGDEIRLGHFIMMVG